MAENGETKEISQMSEAEMRTEILVNSRNAAFSSGVILAKVDSLAEKTDAMHKTIEGNGDPRKGLVFKVLTMEDREVACEGKNFGKFRDEFKADFANFKTEIEEMLQALKNLNLLKEGEKAGAKEEKNKQEARKTLLRDMIAEFISSKPIRSFLITLAGILLTAIGTWLGVSQAGEHRHRNNTMPERAAVEASGNTTTIER